MVPALMYALVMAAGLGIDAPARAADAAPSPAARCEALAGGLRLAARLQPVVADMCRRAPTFRRPVVRLAAQPGLVVTVEPAVFAISSRALAMTDITRVNGEVRTAYVRVPAGHDLLLVELLGHEFEHILEQLDGVELSTWVGRSGVYRVGDPRSGPVETERARQVGRLVAGEFAAATAEITALKVR